MSKKPNTTSKYKETPVTSFDDPVNHPSHYTTHPSGVECIDITQHFNFNLGNAIKYIWRSGIKSGNTAEQDLMKARFYINQELKRLGVQTEGQWR